jgi:hypothetical protein
MKKYDHTFIIAEWERMGRPEVVRYSTAREGWEKDEDHKFIVHFQYRIKSKPSINWDNVSEDVAAIATFPDGVTCLFMSEPNMTGRHGIRGGGIIYNAKLFTSFTPGTCDWRDSLVMRPVVVGEKSNEITAAY